MDLSSDSAAASGPTADSGPGTSDAPPPPRSRTARPSLREYAELHPVGARDTAALYAAYVRSIARFLWSRGRARSIGDSLHRPITVRSAGLIFEVRPRCDDLFYVLPGHKGALRRWFHPGPGEVVVDIGAHLGFHALLAARAGAEVLAIEPNPRTFDALRRNLALNRREEVRTLQSAVGRFDGVARLYQPGAAAGVSSVLRDWSDRYGVPPGPGVEVPMARLESIWRSRGGQTIDWLLIDAEGSEADILEGAAEVLERVRHVVVEVEHGPNEARCEALLRAHGLSVTGRERQNAVNSYWIAERPDVRDGPL